MAVSFTWNNALTDKVCINCDGASRGNPGPAAIGATIKDESGQLITSISRRLGHTTNNQAEYRAVIAALEEAAKLGAARVALFCDSELVVKQLKGQYRVKNEALKRLYQQALKLSGQFQEFKVSYVPRHRNREADALANKAF